MRRSVGSFQTSLVERAFDYWSSKAVDRLPSRRDLLPEEMRELLPYLFLVDVEPIPLGFRFRLVGTEISRWARREYTGVRLNAQEYGPNWRSVFDTYARVIRTAEPEVACGAAPWVGREFLRYERLIAPLSCDQRTVNKLFGALYPLLPPGTDPAAK